MQMNELHNHFSKASRGYEIPMRNVENAIAQAQRLELELTRESVNLLKMIASVQISDNPQLDDAVQNHIKQRAHEEQRLRMDLVTIEAEIGCLISQLRDMGILIEGLETQFALKIESDEAYAQISREIEIAEAQDHERKLQYLEIREEVSRKAPAYRDNELLVYLVRVQYGTPAYSRWGIFRYLDSWIARLCNFDLNRNNQIILGEMDSANESNCNSHVSPVMALQLRRSARQREIEGGLGLPSHRADYTSLEASIAKRKDRANAIQDGLAKFRKQEDPHYLAATEAMAELLQRKTPQEILEIVQQTQSDLDDQSLSDVIEIQRKIQAIQTRIPQLKVEHEQTRVQYQRAKEIEREVRASSRVTNEYEYRGIDVDALVSGFVLGRLQPSDVLRDIQEHQSLIPVTVEDNDSKGWSSPYSNENPSRNTSPDVFETSASNGGDSFSTTDSF